MPSLTSYHRSFVFRTFLTMKSLAEFSVLMEQTRFVKCLQTQVFDRLTANTKIVKLKSDVSTMLSKEISINKWEN